MTCRISFPGPPRTIEQMPSHRCSGIGIRKAHVHLRPRCAVVRPAPCCWLGSIEHVLYAIAIFTLRWPRIHCSELPTLADAGEAFRTGSARSSADLLGPGCGQPCDIDVRKSLRLVARRHRTRFAPDSPVCCDGATFPGTPSVNACCTVRFQMGYLRRPIDCLILPARPTGGLQPPRPPGHLHRGPGTFCLSNNNPPDW